MTYFIISFVVIILLVVAMSLVLKNAVKEVDDKSKSYFVDKLQEYDYLIDEKEDKLKQIDKKIKDKELKNNEEDTEIRKGNYEFDYNIISLLNETKYQNKNIRTKHYELMERNIWIKRRIVDNFTILLICDIKSLE